MFKSIGLNSRTLLNAIVVIAISFMLVGGYNLWSGTANFNAQHILQIPVRPGDSHVYVCNVRAGLYRIVIDSKKGREWRVNAGRLNGKWSELNGILRIGTTSVLPIVDQSLSSPYVWSYSYYVDHDTSSLNLEFYFEKSAINDELLITISGPGK